MFGSMLFVSPKIGLFIYYQKNPIAFGCRPSLIALVLLSVFGRVPFHVPSVPFVAFLLAALPVALHFVYIIQ